MTRRIRAWSVEYVLLAVIVGAAAIVSYNALVDVARVAGWGTYAPLLPVIIDAFALVAALSIDRLKRYTWYPWCLIVALTAGSSILNALHHEGLELTVWQRIAINCLPPALGMLAYHLLRMIKVLDVKAARKMAVGRGDTAAPDPPNAADMTTTKVPRQRAKPRTVGKPARYDLARGWLDHNPQGTPTELAKALKIPRQTASRYAARWRDEPRLVAVGD